MKRFERSNGLDTALYKNYLYLLNMSRIHNSKWISGRFLILTGCVSSYKSAMAS